MRSPRLNLWSSPNMESRGSQKLTSPLYDSLDYLSRYKPFSPHINQSIYSRSLNLLKCWTFDFDKSLIYGYKRIGGRGKHNIHCRCWTWL